MSESKKRCCEKVHNREASFDMRYEQCKHPGKVERDGKPYCGIHDPVRRNAKRDERYAAYRANQDAVRTMKNRMALEHHACDGMTDDELRAMIAARRER